MSEGSVWRRLQVAGVCQRFPQLLVALSENRMSLRAASLLAPSLCEENVHRLLSEAEGKSTREVKEMVASLRPKETFKSSARKQPAPTNAASTKARSTTTTPNNGGVGEVATATAPETHACESPRPQPILTPATEELYNIRFSAGKDFMGKLERFAEILGIESPRNHLEEVFAEALEIALEARAPERKLKRRQKRQARERAKRERAAEKGAAQPQPAEMARRQAPRTENSPRARKVQES